MGAKRYSAAAMREHRRRPPFRIALALLACAALAAGCGKKEKNSDKAEGSGGKVTESAGSGGPVAAKRAAISLPSNEPKFLNPLLAIQHNRANMLIFEGLVGLDRKLEPVPRLAESWEIGDDGKTITFKLRDGVKWHDGKPFTSKDVAFTFKALRSVTELPTLWAAFMVDVDAVETPDDKTVIVKYAKPYAPALVTWTMGILPEHVYGAGKLSEVEGNTKPVGTGPYKLSRWDIGSRMVLVANDKWWHGEPKIGTVNLIFNVKDELAAIRSGKLDFADIRDTTAWVNQSTLPEFRAVAESTSVPGSLYRVVAWNTQRAPFKDQRVRLALTQALNRKRVVDDLLVGWGQLLPAPMFPNMFGLDRSIAPHKFDLEAAKKLLDEARLPATSGRRFGFTLLTLESQRTQVNEEMLARWRTDLARALNVELKVEYLPYADWKERVADKRNFDAAFFGWLPEIPDPDPYNLLHSSQVETGRQNFAGYNSPEADALLEQARATADRDERRKIYEKLNTILHRDLPYTVTYAPFRHYAWSRRLRGVDPADVGEFARFPGLATWWVESDGK